jgi:hypothetical protein
MKIENYEGTADTFTFPHNPKVYDNSLEKFVDVKNNPYYFSFYGMASPLKNRQSIVINGHFDGSTKNSDYRNLSKHCNESALKKLYFENTKFAIVIPNQCKRTHSGGRTLFIDYVASFTSPFSMLFSSTQKNGGSTSAEENEGNILTPIEKITGSVTSGTKVQINDVNENGFEFTPSNTGTMTVYLIKMGSLGGDLVMTEYIYIDVGGTQYTPILSNSDKRIFLTLEADESLDDAFNGATISGVTNLTFYFRDGYSSD